eukprot:7223538-Karenia_brevis.AAC.1
MARGIYFTAAVTETPFHIHRRRVSDHSPFVITWKFSQQKTKMQQEIPAWVAKSKEFSGQLQEALQHIDFRHWDVAKQLEVVKEVMRAVAK